MAATGTASSFAVVEAAPSASAVASVNVPAPAPAPVLRPLGANETAAVVIRTKPKYPAQPVEWTRFLEADGTMTSQKGVLLSFGGVQYQYKQREQTSANPPCVPNEPNPYPKKIWRNAEVVPIKPGKTSELIPFYKPKKDEEGIPPVETEHELAAVIPGYLFVRTSITDYGCGAHALYGRQFTLFAYQTNGTFDTVDAVDYEEGVYTGIEKAVAKFNATVDPSEPADSLDGRVGESDVKPAMTYPAMTARGAEWTVLYYAQATWAGSYGGWAGYTRAVPITLGAAPKRFREAMVMPEVVAKYVAAHEKDEDIVGFTIVEKP